MTPLSARALDALEDLLDACAQSGPDARDLDIDREALVGVVQTATVILYEAKGRA